MFISRTQSNIIFLIILSVILLISIFKWVDYLTNENYIVECFDNSSHTVDLPLTTTYSCKNFCGPNARCSISGQQCLADIDCSGCQPNDPPLKQKKTNNVPGDNDAGKLTLGVTPQYSPLTSGYGTHERIITSNMYSKPSQPNFGVNTWFKEFDESKNLFNKRYKPPQLQYMPNYPKRYTLTGDFIEDGPFASNANINII